MKVEPGYSRNQVKKAGKILKSPSSYSEDKNEYAYEVLGNWRASHYYPLNTFQASLRKYLKEIDKEAIVAQRLKRESSIISKLQRFSDMQLGTMQDIGGLRAVVSDIKKLRKIEACYKNNARLKHKLVSSDDYVESPKPDGYRSIHLVYRYNNRKAIQYNGLQVELQLRTKIQHAWATAVETMGTFLGQALKSGQGDDNWLDFFSAASAALSIGEGTPKHSCYSDYNDMDIYRLLAGYDRSLNVLSKLSGFTIAANAILKNRRSGAYNLIVLDSLKKQVKLKYFASSEFDRANQEYSDAEKQARSGEKIEAVLVAAGPIKNLKKAYPNYFLDTSIFYKNMRNIIRRAKQ